MIFKKKKRMIDISELQRKGVVRIPKERISVPTTNDGFVELGNLKEETKKPANQFFDFTNNSNNDSEFSTEQDGYNKREVDAKVTDLDNKIYKLEQRVELLEKKLDVNQQNNSGIIGW